MKITAPLLRQWEACWTDDEIAARLGSRPHVTPAEVAADESISLDDRLWVLCRSLWYIDERATRFFAIESASLVAHLAGDEDDQGVYLGLLNDLAQIENEVAPEGRGAARDAAWGAAGAAAWGAARAAAWASAMAAAWAAARDAARDAAWAAAGAAAMDAELRKALARALEWLGEEATS